MADDIVIVKMQLFPGKANPAPPVGSMLGSRGVNIMQFCKEFNDKTKDMDQSMKVTSIIYIKKDKSFTLEIKLPGVSSLIKKAMKLESGSKEPGKVVVGNINISDIKKIAEMKKGDMNCFSIDSAVKMIAGTARSMGIKVVYE